MLLSKKYKVFLLNSFNFDTMLLTNKPHSKQYRAPMVFTFFGNEAYKPSFYAYKLQKTWVPDVFAK